MIKSPFLRACLLLLLVTLIFFFTSEVHAQGAAAVVVSTCGNRTYTAGQVVSTTQDTKGNGCINEAGGSSPPPLASSTTNASLTVATGGTFQQLAASSTTRKSLEFQNICNKSGNCVATTDNCYLFIGPTASATLATSVLVTPGSYYLRASGSIPSDNIAVTCDGNADKVYGATQ